MAPKQRQNKNHTEIAIVTEHIFNTIRLAEKFRRVEKEESLGIFPTKHKLIKCILFQRRKIVLQTNNRNILTHTMVFPDPRGPIIRAELLSPLIAVLFNSSIKCLKWH